ncbi:MAG: hypothetical protein IJJ28_03270, partial [Lentisphaeria bacterium]|nr:hypothetical protein [Lentisphaeria bacterium]
HRDIKPDNILFVAGVPKLGDIGLISSLSRTLSIIGTTAFVPPEILTGQKKTPDCGCDLYALGKTLYCAFSGNDAGEFPLVPPEALRHPYGRRFNKLVKRCCAETPGMRIRTTDEFRRLLYGRFAWQLDWRRLLHWTVWVLLLPPRLLVLGWRLRYCRLLPVLLFCIWLYGVRTRYTWLRQNGYGYRYMSPWHWPLMKQSMLEWYLPWYLPLAGYDHYDFIKKDARWVKRFGEHWWVTRKSYLSSKNPYIRDAIFATIEVGGPNEKGAVKAVKRLSFIDHGIEQSTPLRDEYLHELVFSGLDDRKLRADGDVEWRDGVMILPASRHGRLKYAKELPLRSDIQMSLDTEMFSGRIEFILTTADYIPPYGQKKPPDILLKRQVRFALNSDGRTLTFAEAIYRPQDAAEEDVRRFGAPKVGSLPAAGGFHRFRIVSVTEGIRVYCDDKLIWGTQLAFYGGYFELRYSGTGLRVGEFSIYDAKLVQPDETRTSRLRIP